MRNYFLIAILFTFYFSDSFSQDIIEVNYEVDSRGYYNFYCNNNDYCNYIVEIFFTNITNLNFRVNFPYRVEVSPGRNYLFELGPGKPNIYSTFKYNYKCIKGCINPKVNLNFTYLLPIGIGKETEPFEISYLRMNARDPEPKDFYAIGLKVRYGDTVYAARRGTVTGIRDTAKLQLSNYIYSSNDNFIEINHNDCSFGSYQIFSQIFVKLGQKVEAGDPIGLAGGDKYSSEPHIRFWVYYNYEQQFDIKNKDGSNRTLYWAYVPLIFYTKENKNIKLVYGNKYTSEHPDSLITQEMTKRQIKKWEKSKNHRL